jgi:hypothetical protein
MRMTLTNLVSIDCRTSTRVVVQSSRELLQDICHQVKQLDQKSPKAAADRKSEQRIFIQRQT